MQFLSIDDVKKKTTLSKTAIYDKIKNSGFPASVKIGAQAVAWVEKEVEDWMERCVSASRSGSIVP
jgi:prophage regulatory protein